MYSLKICISAFIVLGMTASLFSQDADSSFTLSGIIYDETFSPIGATHVINMNTRAGDVSDTLGIFSFPAHVGDTLLFRNIAYQEVFIPVKQILGDGYVILRRVLYPLQEAKVFPWGSSYGDFSEAVINTPAPQTIGEALGLPRQDPDYIPFDMDAAKLKSVGFLLKSPISYLYYNLNKKEKNRRKLFWSDKNRESLDRFDAIVSPENLSHVTGLSGNKLLGFMNYLFQRLVCDHKCSELSLYAEIYVHWGVYKQLHPEISSPEE